MRSFSEKVLNPIRLKKSNSAEKLQIYSNSKNILESVRNKNDLSELKSPDDIAGIKRGHIYPNLD